MDSTPPQPRRTRLARAAMVSAIPLTSAAVGITTNLVTAAWNWALAGALLAFVIGSIIATVLVDWGEAGPDTSRREQTDRQQDTRPVATEQQPATVAGVNTLPRDLGVFTGRHEEVRLLVEAATSRAESALAIHAVDGMGGVGKTTLAVHVAHLLATEYPDAQLYVNLRGYLSDQAPMRPGEALEVLLVALGLPLDRIPPSPDARSALWRAQISRRRAVVVIDNASDAEQVRPLLPGSGGCLVIITSRRRLTLPDVRPLSLAAMPAREAATLFISTVGAIRAADQLPMVDAVVSRCGHLPLAIEVAAAWLAHRPSKKIDDLLAALDTPLDAVTATLELSVRSLPTAARQVFLHLGQHPGPIITGAVAAALTGLDVTSASRAIDVLYEHNLLQEMSRSRYQFHDLVREFARQAAVELDSSGVERLLRSYLEAAAAADRLLGPGVPGTPEPADEEWTKPPTDTAARAWFEAELPNLLACARHAIEHRVVPHAWMLPSVMSRYFRERGYALQARPLLIGALRIATTAGDPLAQANCHLGLGTLDQIAGNHTAARSHFNEANAHYEQVDSALGSANASMELGVLDQISGDYAAAQRRFETAMQGYQQLGNVLGQAYAHAELAAVAKLLNAYAEARKHVNSALTYYDQAGSQAGQAEAYSSLGGIDRLTGDWDAARVHLTRALHLHTALGHGRGQAYAQVQLGALHRATGEHTAARKLLYDALTSYHDAGDRMGMAFAYSQLGMLDRVIGEHPAARGHFEQALSLYRGVGSLAGEANTLTSLGILERLMGDYTAALSNLDRALALYTTLHDRAGQADAHTELAATYRESGDAASAHAELSLALPLWIAVDSTAAADRARTGLAALQEST
ncbi:tetratricopeptide repeat protein [Solwaraspora sp. WMMD791]|uniref:ATP-binding protein n=1 Tax=Solwaraspora sp. WMMD791 TaxID=3016086 RepID=UPI00249BF642|nr:tetratricopeptide repeat protein [Solwaraspora sp. WMMD791]WFE27174.1 tetratricopeptide repeat protein [Solwaraspora sp. WMMD791]